MSGNNPIEPLPENVGSALDALLAGWAARHDLSPARAETIRQRVLHTPLASSTELTYAGWNRFFETLTLPLRQATDMRRLFTPGFSSAP